MGTSYNLLGYTTGNLRVLREHEHRDSQGSVQWVCQCLCGDLKVTTTNKLIGSRKIQSCGSCQWHIKHKDAYISWQAMKRRCEDASAVNAPYYKDKGITVCEHWKIFENFFVDMGDPPIDETTGLRYTLDRIKNDLGYSKDNCRWASRKTQIDNRAYSWISRC